MNIQQILDILVATWDKINVWLPISVGSFLLLAWRIAKTIVDIVKSKKEKVEINLQFNSLIKQLEQIKCSATLQQETLENCYKALTEVCTGIVNPEVKMRLKNELKNIKNCLEKKVVSDENHTEDIIDDSTNRDNSEETKTIAPPTTTFTGE